MQLLFPKLSIENAYKNAPHKHKQVQTQNASKFQKPSKRSTIMATKIVFIAACVLAVTANAVRVAQDQDDGYEQQNTDYEPKKTDYEPKKTDYEPKKTDYLPKRVVCVGKRFLESLLSQSLTRNVALLFPIRVACLTRAC